MSEEFGPGASQLAGLAARLLGWRPDEFWNATPAELVACFADDDTANPPSRDEIHAMMERERDG